MKVTQMNRENELRLVLTRDHKLVAQMAGKTIQEVYPHYYPAGAVQFFLDFHSERQIEEALKTEQVYLLMEGDVILGTGSIRENEICRLFILPEHQGNGYGKAALDLLEEKVFKEHPRAKVDASFPAENMYLNRGYRICSYERIKTENGDYLCYHTMEKQLRQKALCAVDEIKVRPIKEEEYPLLDDFLYEAIFLPEGTEPPPKDVIRRPELAVYIRDFGESGDHCLVAESNGKVLGVVWTRILSGKEKGYGYVDDTVPEFAISVKKEFRHRGIGDTLMREMIGLLKKSGYEKASLSVNKENYAYGFYRRLGFQTVKEQGEEVLMLLRL